MSEHKIIKVGYLPWQRKAREGFEQMDLTHVDITGTFDVLRNKPTAPPAGNFVVYHNGVRISDRSHAQRGEAIAEAETYYFALPQNVGKPDAVLLNVSIERGRQGCRDGLSVYSNPFGGDKPVERSLWLQGWLEASLGGASAKLINSLTATAQANQQLESDNEYLLSVARICRIAIRYAGEEIQGKKGMAFLTEWYTSNDPANFNEKYPDWIEYRDAKIAEINAELAKLAKQAVN